MTRTLWDVKNVSYINNQQKIITLRVFSVNDDDRSEKTLLEPSFKVIELPNDAFGGTVMFYEFGNIGLGNTGIRYNVADPTSVINYINSLLSQKYGNEYKIKPFMLYDHITNGKRHWYLRNLLQAVVHDGKEYTFKAGDDLVSTYNPDTKDYSQLKYLFADIDIMLSTGNYNLI